MRLIFEWHSRRKILRTIGKLFRDSSQGDADDGRDVAWMAGKKYKVFVMQDFGFDFHLKDENIIEEMAAYIKF